MGNLALANKSALSVKIEREEAIKFFDGKFRQVLENVPEEVLCLPEYDLQTKVQPTYIDWKIRQTFWEQISLAKAADSPGSIATVEVYRGHCSREYFYAHFMVNPYRIAWLTTQPESMQDMVDEACVYAMRKLRYEILTMPVTDKTASTILKAAELLMTRSMGPVVHKIEAKTLSASMNLDSRPRTKDEIEAEFLELQNKLQSARERVVNVKSEDPE